MPEDQKGSSAEENKLVKLSVDQVIAENISLKAKVQELEGVIDGLNVRLKSANDLLEAQTRAKLIADIKPRTRYSDEDFAKFTVDELTSIKVTLDNAKLPTYKNIHFGPISSDERKDEGLTVGDLSVVTEAKRKQGA